MERDKTYHQASQQPSEPRQHTYNGQMQIPVNHQS